jgi:DnaJ-class molecular chaperone
MEIKKALEVLELHENECNEHNIKKQYRLKALKYHPDKSGSNTTTQFQEIQEAYECLLSKKDHMSNDYNSLFTDFLHSINDNGILNSIFQTLQDKCFENVYEYISHKSLVDIIHIKTILSNYKHILCIPDHILLVLDDVIRNKKSNLNCYILNPCLDDLLQGNIYKLKFGDEEIYVPLWYNILEHQDSIITVCELQEKEYNYRIDECKNIHIDCLYSIDTLLNSDEITKKITANYSITFKPSDLVIKKNQLMIIENAGIPYPDKNNIYSDKHRSNIILHFSIY